MTSNRWINKAQTIGVKFVNPGDEGIAAESIIDATALIAELEPHLKAAEPSNRQRWPTTRERDPAGGRR